MPKVEKGHEDAIDNGHGRIHTALLAELDLFGRFITRRRELERPGMPPQDQDVVMAQLREAAVTRGIALERNPFAPPTGAYPYWEARYRFLLRLIAEHRAGKTWHHFKSPHETQHELYEWARIGRESLRGNIEPIGGTLRADLEHIDSLFFNKKGEIVSPPVYAYVTEARRLQAIQEHIGYEVTRSFVAGITSIPDPLQPGRSRLTDVQTIAHLFQADEGQ